MEAVLADLEGTASLGVVATRLLAACVLGGLIGLEREMRYKPAGLRAHVMVALAAAAFTIITYETFEARLGEDSNADPLRLVEAIIGGVAFLGAGAIIQGHGSVQGLTSGTGMWVAGAVGFACGLGYIVVAAMVTACSLVVLVVLGWLARRLGGPDDD